MNERQEKILKLIVDEYIRQAEPVGSKYLSQASNLDVSPATVRNDMAFLEREGFVTAPHTSAGRIPTEKAYIHYLQHFVEADGRKAMNPRLKASIRRDEDRQMMMRELAKALTELSGEMAIVAVDPRRSYYTGVSNLFQKPDFQSLAMVHALSTLVDRFDDVVAEVFDAIEDEPSALIGSQNPFGEHMSSIMVRYQLPSGAIGILGLVGPMRMDYRKNMSLLKRAKELLDEGYE